MWILKIFACGAEFFAYKDLRVQRGGSQGVGDPKKYNRSRGATNNEILMIPDANIGLRFETVEWQSPNS